MAHIQTVLGPVKQENLGLTLPHEHIICDASLCRSRREQAEIFPRGSYMWFDEPETMVEELRDFRKNGGGCVVEVTARRLVQ